MNIYPIVVLFFFTSFMIPEDGESTTNVTQTDIIQAADITTAQKVTQIVWGQSLVG